MTPLCTFADTFESLLSVNSSRPDYQDARIRLVRRKLIDLERSTTGIEHLSLRTINEGSMIIRQSSNLALHLFTVGPPKPRILKQELKLKVRNQLMMTYKA